MDYNEQISIEVDRNEFVKKPKLDSICNVCGIEGAQIHYGGICCVSCKMFFRRNSEFNLVSEFN
jgi:hypothetical protein